MKNLSRIKELKSLLNELKKEKQTPTILRWIYRIKALIAYYKGNAIDIVASCYDISTKTLKRWIKKFETLGCEYLRDKARSGRPSKLSAEELEALKEIIKTQLLPLGLKDDEIVTVLEADREFIAPLEIP